MIKIAIAEDNPFLLHSIKERIGFFDDLSFRFSGNNGAELIGKLEANHAVDVILMDIQMPEMDGIEATQIIKSRFPQIKIIMLTVFDDDENIFRSIQAGANGYLLKDIDPDQLHSGIIEIMEGGAPMSPSIALKALNLLRNPLSNVGSNFNNEEVNISEREKDVLEQLSKGLNYIEIAKNLFISPATVRKHIENIYKKLQVHNKVEAIQKAKDIKLI